MRVSLQLLGPFSISVEGTPVEVAPAGQRVLALLALRGGAAHRSGIAGTLWPDRPERRALANLRSALWRVPDSLADSVQTSGLTLHTAGDWTIDTEQLAELADAGGCRHFGPQERRLLVGDLLPEWDEPWLTVERERHRQIRLHALEDTAAAELDADRPLDAVDTAMIAVADEPLRESAQLLLIRAHLEAGNRATALRQFERFELDLREQLGVGPSGKVLDLVASATNG